MANQILAQLEMVDLLYKCRDGMRVIFGDNYEKSSQEFRQLLPAIHERFKGANLLESVIAQAGEMEAAGLSPSMLFSAYVDEVEARNA